MEIKGEDSISGECPIILVTNDDAAGLRSLVRVLVSTNLYDVRVCAPDSEKSAVRHNIICSRPLTAQRVEIDAVSGTPADCTGSGLPEAICPSLPDLVLSGIKVGINCGSSHVPLFSTQCTEDASLGKNRPAKRRERKKWTPTEDFVLISSWLNTSKDGVVGNEQNSGPFWKRLAAYYKQVAGGEKREREPDHCKQRWQKINDMVCKFCGSYEAAKREKRSGQNENDVLKLAHQNFYNDHKKKFTLQHAWNELRSHQKWYEVYISKVDGSYKRRKCEDGAQSSSSHTVSNVDGQATKRPPGFEAAKDKGKTSIEECKALSEFQSMWTIKEKDLVMKERLTTIKLLDTLLARKKPLSKIEEALKNKLITDMLCN